MRKKQFSICNHVPLRTVAAPRSSQAACCISFAPAASSPEAPAEGSISNFRLEALFSL